jgi:uncharacterized protein (TIGR01777 family)
MKFLITGGTGLIGRKLISHLLKMVINTKDSNVVDQANQQVTSQIGIKNTVQITVLTRDPIRAAKLLGEHINFITELSLHNVNKQDVIINLAGEAIADKRWSTSQKNKICESRWDITEQLVELIKLAENPPKLFVSGSAIGYYGRQHNQAINESFTDFHDEFSHQLCKRWEQIAQTAESADTRVVLLRTGIVLDKKSGALAKMLPAFKFGGGGKIASGDQVMSWIHIDDMVRGIVHVIDRNELKGAINMTAPNPVTNQEFSLALSKTLSRPCILNMPAVVVKLLFGEMSDLLIYGQRVVPVKLVESDFIFTQPTVEAALENLIKVA